MLHRGQRVAELTKKVGQIPRTGKIEAIRGKTVEVRWDDGHTSVVSSISLTPSKKKPD